MISLKKSIKLIKKSNLLENNNTLPFLNILLIQKNNKNNGKVYRKKAKLDHIIRNDAVVPWIYKLSAIKYYINNSIFQIAGKIMTEDIQSYIHKAIPYPLPDEFGKKMRLSLQNHKDKKTHKKRGDFDKY